MSQIKISSIINKKMMILFALGFSSGLPLLMTGGTLKTWLAREQVDISTIGYFGWVGLAYSLKFLWAPLLDRFHLLGLGRRRSWILLTQACLVFGVFALGQMSPAISLGKMAAISILIAFFSATQDIAIDAYRREICKDEELGLGASMGMYGYRIAMLVSGGVGIGLVGSDFFDLTWSGLYSVIAILLAVGMILTWFAPEPEVAGKAPKNLKAAFIEPFQEYLSREGAWTVLFFVFLFKLGDALGGAMLSPFYVQMGFNNQEIGLIAKTVGLASSLGGLLLGSLIIVRMGIYRSLWIFGILQALSTAGFALITFVGPKIWALAATVIFEDVSAGMGNAAFVAFIASVCNRRYTATQFAILSSIATLGRTFFSGFSGEMVKALDWAPFFFTCAVIAVPGLVMLFIMRKYQPAQLS